ncbi:MULTISPECIES: YggS family pyridoxal phosphate-dependent enzyme [unclassified Crossiella]|uniref:YggS family pyridoxal phosphate-dependent enzyme n=1 Tax=unclassified Crossiella TaxID=2620835 RepID=UPI001FFF99B8|nr:MULTISPECIES: YggS family pyridoxal phosphate-dependent enzyme [unclassified Crossiella]MCK2240267.1 YggS family pyridoxal phosphate-dependent enzyme [Crossiella sp. S99.2]MCK2253281.1 YggS family pyridoxal phosphate-dependent enzyme [Crossiella sp. S99.1]
MTGELTREQRRAELAAALTEIRERIDAACAKAGRDPAEVQLLPITKNFPASDAALLAELGLTEFGESREQEAAAKAAELAAAGIHPRWHLIGRLQRNKSRAVLRWAGVVQTVDSVRLAEALAGAVAKARAEGEREAPLDVLVQLSLDGDPHRGGVPQDQLAELVAKITRSGELSLKGVMAVAPLGSNPHDAFGELAEVSARLRDEHPGAVMVSAGMSGDLEAAIDHGSTCVRVGTSLLGGRRLTSP